MREGACERRKEGGKGWREGKVGKDRRRRCSKLGKKDGWKEVEK